MKRSHSRGVCRTAFAGLIALLLAPAALTPVHAQMLPQAPDPSAPGPYAVTKEEYAFGTAADPTGQTTLASTSFIGYTTSVRPASSGGPVAGFGGPVEMIGSVWYPSTAAGNGIPVKGPGIKPFPLIVFLHGRHSSVYNPTTGKAGAQWPPIAPNISVPSYEGYDYASSVLASDGYVVISK